MMSGFTQRNVARRGAARGNRVGSFAANLNMARRQNVSSQLDREQESAKQANLARQKQITSMYDEMMQRFQPGGAFEKRGLGQIERARTKGVGQEMQQMISSGLFGTTTAAQTGRRWEAEVGAPSRLRLEDIMQQRLTGIQQQKAGFLERIEDVYPNYSALVR
jgi:hypothetical protein